MKVPREAVRLDERRALEEGVVVCRHDDLARFRLTGSGRVACLQGLVSCDVAKAPDDSLLFGALLTSKGMIVAPLWITRLADQLLVELPAAAAPAVAETLARSLPPRLCRFEDVSAGAVRLGAYGPRTAELAPAGALPAVARGAAGREWLVPAADVGDVLDALAGRGATIASRALMESVRILAGIPRLGAEMDEKTLPQEARLEELGAISYTKGCYVGQETVARLHFRGHANRTLALLVLDGEPAVPDEVRAGGKPVGRLTSATWADDLDAWVGLGILRREAADGAEVALAGGGTGVVRRDRWLSAP